MTQQYWVPTKQELKEQLINEHLYKKPVSEYWQGPYSHDFYVDKNFKQYIKDNEQKIHQEIYDRKELVKKVTPYVKETAQFIANEAINKVPGGNIIMRGAKYLARRAASKVLQSKQTYKPGYNRKYHVRSYPKKQYYKKSYKQNSNRQHSSQYDKFKYYKYKQLKNKQLRRMQSRAQILGYTQSPEAKQYYKQLQQQESYYAPQRQAAQAQYHNEIQQANYDNDIWWMKHYGRKAPRFE